MKGCLKGQQMDLCCSQRFKIVPGELRQNLCERPRVLWGPHVQVGILNTLQKLHRIMKLERAYKAIEFNPLINAREQIKRYLPDGFLNFS